MYLSIFSRSTWFAVLHVERLVVFVLLLVALPQESVAKPNPRTFAEVVVEVGKYTSPIVLRSNDKQAQILVVPGLQGRVLTSCNRGESSESFGWIDRAAIKSGKGGAGGEDRLWLGPMETQHGLFFPVGAEFVDANWRVPADLAEGAMKVVSEDRSSVTMQRMMNLVNYEGTKFSVRVDRKIRLLSKEEIVSRLGLLPGELSFVAFESENRLTNVGPAWDKATGMLNLWILGKFPGQRRTKVVVPTADDPKTSADFRTYLFPLGADRLRYTKQLVLFAADGRYRSKVGVGPRLARPLFGAVDTDRTTLTLVQFTLPESTSNETLAYPSHGRGSQKHPYVGDVINSYNHGPMDGSIGRVASFYELESSSPALPLKTGESIEHRHTTLHFTGPVDELDRLALATLGLTVSEFDGLPR